MEESINLEGLIDILKRKMYLILFTSFFGLLCSGLITYFVISPKYNAETQLVIKTDADMASLKTDNINYNLLLINTYKDLIKSKRVLGETKNILKNNGQFGGSIDELSKFITIEQNTNSQMFSIVVVTKDPFLSMNISNTVSEVFQKEASNMAKSEKISIVSRATLENIPISPNKKINLLIGTILGIIFGVLLSILLELINNKVSSVDYITDVLKLVPLGSTVIVSEHEKLEIQKMQQLAIINNNYLFKGREMHNEISSNKKNFYKKKYKKHL